MWFKKKQIVTKYELEKALGESLESVTGDIVLIDKFRNIWKSDCLSPELKSEIEHKHGPILTEMNVNYFALPEKLLTFQYLQKNPPPNESGVYGWYFKTLNPYVLRQSTTYVKSWFSKWFLLYIGRANNLNRRIFEMHFNGDADVSSLRISLGCLLIRKLKICLWKKLRSNENEYAYTFGDDGEEKLSNWMAENSRISWIVSNDYISIEEEAIEKYTPPLSSRGNPKPFKPLGELKDHLRELAVFRGDNPRWKEVKRAHKKFLKDCKNYEIEDLANNIFQSFGEDSK